MAASKRNISIAVFLYVLFFGFGYWISPYVYNWLLLEGRQLPYVQGLLGNNPGSKVIFGLTPPLLVTYTILIWGKYHLTQSARALTVIVLLIFMVLGALTSKAFMHPYVHTPPLPGETGSKIFIDSRSFLIEVRRAAAGIGLGLLAAYLLLNFIFKQRIGRMSNAANGSMPA